MCSTRVPVHHRAGLGLERPASLARLEHDAVAAVEEHRGLEAGPGAEAGVHEHHRQHLLLQPAAHLAPLDPGREREQALDLVGLQSSSARKSRLVTRAPP